jgi:hypothetical protein
MKAGRLNKVVNMIHNGTNDSRKSKTKKGRTKRTK